MKEHRSHHASESSARVTSCGGMWGPGLSQLNARGRFVPLEEGRDCILAMRTTGGILVVGHHERSPRNPTRGFEGQRLAARKHLAGEGEKSVLSCLNWLPTVHTRGYVQSCQFRAFFRACVCVGSLLCSEKGDTGASETPKRENWTLLGTTNPTDPDGDLVGCRYM